MTELPIEPLTLDSAGFLARLDALIDAFAANRKDAVAPARRLFGPSSWCTVVAAAADRGDPAMVDHATSFLHRCRRAVRERGLVGWLVDLIDEADGIVGGTRSPGTVPVTVCAAHEAQAEQRLRKDADARFGGRRARRSAFLEYSMEAYRLAAHLTAQWGSPERAATRTAYRLATMPYLGRDLLQCAAHTCARCTDGQRCAECRARQPMFVQLLSTLESLRLQADAEYVQAQARGEADADLCGMPRSATERAIDARFLYDQRMLLDGYRALWDESTPTRDDLLLSYDYPDNLRELEDLPLWRNPLYLYEIGASVMGGPLRQQLVAAFDARQADVFEGTAASVEALGRAVRDMGVLVLPAAIVNANVRLEGDARVAAKADRMEQSRTQAMMRDAGLILALERVPFGEGIGFAQVMDCFYRMDTDAYLQLVDPVSARPFSVLRDMGTGGYGGLRWVLA